MLLNTKGCSILHLHLTAHCLLVVSATLSNGSAATATWLDATELQAVAEVVLPPGVCHAWCSPGTPQINFSCSNGDVYTMQTAPEVRMTIWQIPCLSMESCEATAKQQDP